MVRKYDWPLLAGRERFMKEKHRLIPILIFAFILTVLCTAAVSRWYLLHQKGGTYNSILLGKLVSSDGRKLVLQGNITNLQGRNGQYAITYSPGITAADKAKDSHITPPTAIPQLLVTYRTKRKFLLFQEDINYIRRTMRGQQRLSLPAEPNLSPIWSERCRTFPTSN